MTDDEIAEAADRLAVAGGIAYGEAVRILEAMRTADAVERIIASANQAMAAFEFFSRAVPESVAAIGRRRFELAQSVGGRRGSRRASRRRRKSQRRGRG